MTVTERQQGMGLSELQATGVGAGVGGGVGGVGGWSAGTSSAKRVNR